jgi:hypothetical protein
VRDEGLVSLTQQMITEHKWVLGKEEDPQEDAVKNVRIIWEGLFFGKLLLITRQIDFWHSDKAQYQSELA